MIDRLMINIEPRPPFAFDLTVAYHNNFQAQHRAGDLADGPVDGPADEAYRRLLDLGDRLGLATVRSTGSVDAPRLELELRGEGITAEHGARAARQVSWLLGTDQDLGPFYALAGNDPVLDRVVDRFYGLHLPHTATIFEALVLGVVGQQIATNVARIIRTLIIETYGPRAEFDSATYYCFPRPEAIRESSPDELRAMKLTRRKSEYIHGIAGAAPRPGGWVGRHGGPERRRGGQPVDGTARDRPVDGPMGADPGVGPARRPALGGFGPPAGSVSVVPRRPGSDRRRGRRAGPAVVPLAFLRHLLSFQRSEGRTGLAVSRSRHGVGSLIGSRSRPYNALR